MKLTDLAPELTPMLDRDQWGTQWLTFACPKCQRHRLGIHIWSDPPGEQQRAYPEITLMQRVWHAEQGPGHDWESLSVSPSINRDGCGDPCGGWHGFITFGEAA